MFSEIGCVDIPHPPAESNFISRSLVEKMRSTSSGFSDSAKLMGGRRRTRKAHRKGKKATRKHRKSHRKGTRKHRKGSRKH